MDTLLQKRQLIARILFINLILFGIISVFGCMVYNSGDEVTMLNILAGSNELPPSANLPFKHNMHYFINWLLKFLFEKTAAVNWFSVILFSFQFSASVCISYLIYLYSKTWFSAVYILLLFVIFMVYMLMNLTTSTTSLVMGVAGIAMQWHFYKKLKLSYRHFIGPLLIIIASLIRIHTLFLIIVVAIPFFFLLPPRNRLMAIGGIVMTFLVVYFFSFLQQVYYEKNYPGWNTEENYRQAKYNYINYQRDTTSPLLDQWRLEVDMAERFLFFDTQLLSKSKIENLSTVARSSVPFAVLLKYSTWKWTFINNRLFFLMIICFLFVFRYSNESYVLLCTSICIAVLVIFYLVAFRKLPGFVIPGIFFTIVLFAILIKKDFRYTRSSMKYLNAFFLLAVLSWGIIRAYRINQQNLEANNRFKKVYGELKAHPDKLFVCFIDDLKYMKCFDAPKDYPFTNILTLDHPIDIHKQAILKHFSFTGLDEFPSSKSVLFVGADESLFVEYYRKAYNQGVYFSSPLSSFHYSTVKRLLLKE